MSVREEQERKHFESVTAEHEMTVLLDNGLYRHIRFMAPGTSYYFYDLVTWPGHLVICGDAGDYHFSRIRDMFEFFCGERQAAGTHYWINPHYWGEKLQGGASGGRQLVRSYSEDALRNALRSWAYDEALYGEDVEMYPSLLHEAIDRLLDDDDPDFEACDIMFEDGGRALLTELEKEGVIRGETWEWELRDFDTQYLWCCWAIVAGINRYKAAKAAEAIAA